MTKSELREKFLTARMKWDAGHVEQISDGIRNNIKTMLGNMRTIALFWPMEHKNEIDLRPLIRELTDEGNIVALPVIVPSSQFPVPSNSNNEQRTTNNGKMIFRRFISESALTKGKFGLLEPDDSCKEIPYKDIDMVIAPALAVDRQGFRLGYGGGYYDRFLAELKTQNPKTVVAAAIANEFIVSMLPHDGLDMAVAKVFTENEIISIGI